MTSMCGGTSSARAIAGDEPTNAQAMALARMRASDRRNGIDCPPRGTVGQCTLVRYLLGSGHDVINPDVHMRASTHRGRFADEARELATIRATKGELYYRPGVRARAAGRKRTRPIR